VCKAASQQVLFAAAGGGGGGGGDTFADGIDPSKIIYMLHFEDLAGASPDYFVDSSAYGRVAFTGGTENPQRVATEVFGTYGSQLGGGGTTWTTRYAASAEIDFAAQDFVCEGFVRPDAIGSTQHINGQSNGAGSATSMSIAVLITAAGNIRAYAVDAGGSQFVNLVGSTTLLALTYYYYAFHRHGNDWALHLGTVGGAVNLEASATNSGTVNYSSNLWGIGMLGEYIFSGLAGHVDEQRLVIGDWKDVEALGVPDKQLAPA
jgi:hypothetical protein